MAAPEVVLCNPVRTAIGTYGGALKDTPAPSLGAAAIREVLERSGLAPDQVEVKMNSARQAAIGGGQGIALCLEAL
jgi:acetyl-CoA C-acetyltransferase